MQRDDFLDGPSPLDTLETWERYLAELKALPMEAIIRDLRIRDAQRWIERKRQETSRKKA